MVIRTKGKSQDTRSEDADEKRMANSLAGTCHADI